MNLVTVSNAKIEKSKKFGYFTAGVHLLPHKFADGKFNVCKYSTPSCVQSCLNFSGKGGLSKVEESRRRKTLMYINERENYLRQLDAEVYYWKRISKNQGLKFAFRLNLTSDVDYQTEFIDNKTLFEIHKDIVFYDYCRQLDRISLYDNYHLIYSYDKKRHKKCMELLSQGKNIAVVFEEIPETFHGYPVVNGDEHDLIFLHPKGVVVGLKYKKVIRKGFNNKLILETSTLVVNKKDLINQ